MPREDVLNELIRNLDAEHVPMDYIVMAKVVDVTGYERTIRGDELARVLRDPERYQILEARVIYNVKKMRKAILDQVEAAYDEVKRRTAQKAR